MSDEIIDIQEYLGREPGGAVRPPTLSVWGADGDRSRFALPLWRIAYLTGSDRGVIFWHDAANGQFSEPFVVVDLAQDPPRLQIDPDQLPKDGGPASATLHDLGPEGVVVCLGAREGRAWYLLADGRGAAPGALKGAKRESVLFLAGECAGLLFLRDLAEYVEDGDGGGPGV